MVFDNDELNDDEEILQAFDGFVEDIRQGINEEESRTQITSPAKLKQIEFVYKAMLHLAEQTNAKVTYKLNAPFKSMGSVSVEGNILSFTDRVWLTRAAEFATNFEVYPLANGNVRMTYTFHNITIDIE